MTTAPIPFLLLPYKEHPAKGSYSTPRGMYASDQHDYWDPCERLVFWIDVNWPTVGKELVDFLRGPLRHSLTHLRVGTANNDINPLGPGMGAVHHLHGILGGFRGSDGFVPDWRVADVAISWRIPADLVLDAADHWGLIDSGQWEFPQFRTVPLAGFI